MSENESKHDKVLKRTQMWVAVLAGFCTLVVGAYNAKNIFFTKKGPGEVHIEVRADNGQVVPQASIEIAKAQGGVVASADTRADGTYEKKGLDPGNYSLKIIKPNFQPESVFFSVEPAQTAELNIRLKPASSSIRSAVEEVGASWLKQIATPKSKTEEKQPEPTN